jgi:hypothetical protein
VRPSEIKGFFNLIVYQYLKTVIIMAKFEIRFFDKFKNCFIKAEKQTIEHFTYTSDYISINIEKTESKESFDIILDKSTAIKFAKTLRTEINKITESEGQNG